MNTIGVFGEIPSVTRSIAFALAGWSIVYLGSRVDAGPFGRTQVIAVTGDAAPDGNGSLIALSAPTLNDKGQVGFSGLLTGTTGGLSDNQGIFRGDGTKLTQIARKGQRAPDGNGQFGMLEHISLNESGQMALLAHLVGTTGEAEDDFGIFRGDGLTAPLQIARKGQAAPDGNGVFHDFEIPDLNDAGQLAFRVSLDSTSGSGGGNSAIYVGDGTTLTQIVRTTQSVPDGNGEFFSVSRPHLNASGQAAFVAFVSGTSGGPGDDTGIFLGDGTTLTEIVREGEAAPNGNGRLGLLSGSSMVLNDVGQAAFRSGLTGTSGGSGDNNGIFLGDGTTLTEIAREGEAAPDGNGRLSGFSHWLRVNNAGQTAFEGFLRGTSGGSSDDVGIFRGDPGSPGLTQIIREGQAAIDGNGRFNDLILGLFALNDAGQLAFAGSFTGTSGGETDDTAIFFYDDQLGLMQIAREGDSFLGSTIIGLAFNSVPGNLNDEENGLNEFGQVAYSFYLADGRVGIALFTSVPEPSTALLVGLAGLALKMHRRETRRRLYASPTG